MSAAILKKSGNFASNELPSPMFCHVFMALKFVKA